MDKLPPILNLKTRYTSFNCANCGKLIARGRERCTRCGTLADWSKINVSPSK